MEPERRHLRCARAYRASVHLGIVTLVLSVVGTPLRESPESACAHLDIASDHTIMPGQWGHPPTHAGTRVVLPRKVAVRAAVEFGHGECDGVRRLISGLLPEQSAPRQWYTYHGQQMS